MLKAFALLVSNSDGLANAIVAIVQRVDDGVKLGHVPDPLAALSFNHKLLVNVGLDNLAHKDLPVFYGKLFDDAAFQVHGAFFDHRCGEQVTVKGLK